MNNIADGTDQPDNNELDLNVSGEKCETSFSGMSTSNTSRPGEFLKNLFRRDQKPLRTSEKVEDNFQDKSKLLKTTQDQLDFGARDNFPKQNAHSIDDRVNPQEHSEVDSTSEMSFSEIHTSNTGGTRSFSSPTKSYEDQKPTESNSALPVEEPSPNDELKEPEICLQTNDFNNKLDREDNAKMKTNQRESRTINPFTFLKEELLKVFKDKDTNLEPEDSLLSHTQNDVNTKEDAVSISSSKDMDMSSDSKTSWRAEENVGTCQEVKNTLSEEEGEQLDCAFRGNFEEQNEEKMNHVKDREDQPEDRGLGLNVLKEKFVTSVSETQQSDEMMCTSNPSRPGRFFKNLFRRDQKADKEDKPEVITMVSEKKDKQVDSGARGNLSGQNEDINTRDRMNQSEESEIDLNLSEGKSETTCFSETNQTREVMSTSNTSGPSGFSCSAAGVGDQRPRKSNSALIIEEPSLENNHRESETCLQDELTQKLDQEGHADVDMKGLLKTNQRGKRISVLTLFKEDWFPDKHTKSDPEHNLPTASTVSHLEEGSSPFEDFNTGQTLEKSNNDDPFNVVRTKDSSKRTDMKDEGTDEPFMNLFGKIQMLVKTDPLVSGFRGHLKDKNEKNLSDGKIHNITDQMDELEESKLGLKASEKKSETSFSAKQQSDEMMCTSNTSRSEGLFQKLFGRDPNPIRSSEKLQDTQEVNHMGSEKKEEQLHSGFMGNLTEKNKADNVKDRRDLDVSEKQQSQRMCTMKTGQSRGFSCPTTGFGAQKSTEAKSCPVVEELSQEREIHLQEDDLNQKCDQKEVNVQDFLKTNQIEKRAVRPLTLLKEDFSQFKDDLFNVFRIGASKGKDIKPDSSQSEFPRAEDATELVIREEQLDVEVRGNVSEQHEETLAAEDENDQPKDSELDLNFSEEKSEKGFHEVQQSEETLFILDTVRLSAGGDTAADETTNVDEDGPSDILSLSLGLLSLSCADKDSMRGQPGGELWSPKNFASYLTFDPNTANSELRLMERNRKATRYWLDHGHPDHPERFQRCPQVLCREGLLDSVYWEVEWSGGADIGVAYNSISRDGDTSTCLLGHNDRSWSLECSEGSYTPCYNKRRFKASSPEPFTHRVGVYLDWSAGTLSFYCVSQDTMAHLHTFTSTFTEPLYAGFWIWAYEGSVSLSQVELDWERLQ